MAAPSFRPRRWLLGPLAIGLAGLGAGWAVWQRGHVWQNGALAAVGVWLALGVPGLAWGVRRRRREQDEALRRLAEAHEREAAELARAADRAKSQFLATMSHEVRTPLNGIVGFTSLLLETPLSAEQREYVQTIRMSTEALIQLTGDILDFARTEAGRLKLDPLPCDPRDCIEDALDLLAARAGARGIELIHRVDPAVPAAVLVDGGRLRQVLFNLVGNAVKFTEQGEVEVTLARGSAPPPSPPAAPVATGGPEEPPAVWCTLVLAVRDTGIGIAPEHHDRLFRAFSQVDESTTRRYGGTGLGLAICRNLVGLMGGEIGVASAPGQGSTFTFSIRVPVVNATRPVQDLEGRPILLAAPPGPVRREIAGLLCGWHASVRECDTVDPLPAADWDLALVDVGEPLARALAERPAQPPGWRPGRMIGLVPIGLSNELRAALRRHCRFLVNKPVHHDSLFTLVAGALAREPEAAAPAAALGLRVLVVEDDAVNQHLTRRMLQTLGCRAVLAAHGREALDLLIVRGEDFDLVLLDMHLPEMDGLATVLAIRAGHAGPAVQGLPVVALSADARPERRAAGLAAGLNGYLTKPVRVAELEQELRRLCPLRRPEAE